MNVPSVYYQIIIWYSGVKDYIMSYHAIHQYFQIVSLYEYHSSNNVDKLCTPHSHIIILNSWSKYFNSVSLSHLTIKQFYKVILSRWPWWQRVFNPYQGLLTNCKHCWFYVHCLLCTNEWKMPYVNVQICNEMSNKAVLSLSLSLQNLRINANVYSSCTCYLHPGDHYVIIRLTCKKRQRNINYCLQYIPYV